MQPQNSRKKIKPCSGRNACLFQTKNPFELQALSLFALGLSCRQICLTGLGSAIVGRGEKRAGTMYRAPTGKTNSALEMKVESRRDIRARLVGRRRHERMMPG
jgi:hypothetical protein